MLKYVSFNQVQSTTIGISVDIYIPDIISLILFNNLFCSLNIDIASFFSWHNLQLLDHTL